MICIPVNSKYRCPFTVYGNMHCYGETPSFQTVGASVPVSSCLHRILVIFITEKYTNSAKTIRELDVHCQACAHSYLRYSEHAVIWQRRRAHKRFRGVVFWGERWAETAQDGPHSGTPPLNRSRSYITDRSSTTKHIKSVHKSDFSLTNYNGKNRTFRQSRAGQPRSSGSRKWSDLS